uniref:Uncharacterized protein n=1 Tax=Arundo donax TaxID=35708 RepID=A0A0A9H380_ARUDO
MVGSRGALWSPLSCSAFSLWPPSRRALVALGVGVQRAVVVPTSRGRIQRAWCRINGGVDPWAPADRSCAAHPRIRGRDVQCTPDVLGLGVAAEGDGEAQQALRRAARGVAAGGGQQGARGHQLGFLEGSSCSRSCCRSTCPRCSGGITLAATTRMKTTFTLARLHERSSALRWSTLLLARWWA